MRQIIFILVLITLVGGWLRFYKLTQYPIHLGHDEVSQLYDAISLAQTGKDIYGHRYPFIFTSVGDYKPPFYTYVTLLSYKIFGWQEIAVRIPGAIFGTLIIPVIFLFSYGLFRNCSLSLVSSFLTAISPFEIFYARKSFENQAGVLLILIGFSSLLVYLKNKRLKWLYVSALILALGMYTYFSHAILIPILIIAFGLIFRLQIANLPKGPMMLFIILCLPLFWQIMFNPDARNRVGAVGIIQDVKLGQRINNSGAGLKLKTTVDYAFNRYLKQFDPIFLFGNGLDLTKQTFPDIGPLYFCQLPLAILGMVCLIKQKSIKKEIQFLLALILVGTIPSGLTFEEHSPHRMILVLTVLNLISAVGVVSLWRMWCVNFRSWLGKMVFITFSFSLLLINFVYFIHLYTVNYSFERSEFLHYPFKEVALYLWSQRDNYQQLVFDPKFGVDAPRIGTAAQYYLAFYGHYPPEKMQAEYRTGDKPREVLFDKFSVRAVDWREDAFLTNTLLVAGTWSLPPLDQIGKERVVKTFTFLNGQPAFYAIQL